MNMRRHLTPLVTFSLIAMIALVASCSNSSNPMSGGGGPTKELNSGNLPPGRVFVHAFASAGTFNYGCTIHPSMTGSVSVMTGAADSSLVTIANFSFSPPSTSVKPGGSVRWINTGTDHTVTSPP